MCGRKLFGLGGSIVALILFLEACASQAAPPIQGLIFNEDCTNFFYHHPISDGKAGEIIDRYVDMYAAAGVKTLLCNTNAQRTNYRSRVWDAFWDGYDPCGPDDQPFLRAMLRERVSGYRKMLDNMWKVDQQGIDYPARFIARCRYRGISPWITLRMNDCHDMENVDHPIHGTFWKNNPQFRVQGISGHFSRCFDYAHPQVRDYFFSLIVETLERYDIDGLELDFMREPYLFSSGKQAEGGTLLTEWLRNVRKLTCEATKKRGHTIRLGVRVPSCPETAKAFGLDAIAWAQEGLIDLVVPSPRWATIEFDMPLVRWRELLAGTEVSLAGGLEVSYRPCPACRPRCVTPTEAAGAAANVLFQGAEAVYLFNYMQDGPPHWPMPVYQATLSAMNSLEALAKMPRCVALTYRDIHPPNKKNQLPLPATGKVLSFSLPRGPAPCASSNGTLLLACAASQKASAPAPTVRIHGKPCPLLKEELREGVREISYSISPEVLRQDAFFRIQVFSNGEALTVYRVEVSF